MRAQARPGIRIFFLITFIIWEPNAPLGQLLYNGDPDSLDVYGYELDHCLIKREACNLPGGEEACETHLNYFDMDPVFRDPDNGDYSLVSCSPVHNLGLNYADLGVLDLANHSRILEGRVDLGAYETRSSVLQLTAVLTNASSSTTNDGSIELSNIEGGAAPYTYEWSNGDTIAFIDMLLPDDYQLILTDTQGCTIDSIFTVSFTNGINPLDTDDFQWYLTSNPAPVDGISQLFFENLEQDDYTLEIVNALGQSLHTISFNADQPHKRVQLKSAFAPSKGTYYLILKNKRGQVLGTKSWLRI